MAKLLLVLIFGALLAEFSPRAQARSPSYGVKLCGREFIRAVIFTCGGSRWRRTGEPGSWGGDGRGVGSSRGGWEPGLLGSLGGE
uniref:Uncharacterized protein n=1 Tax=Sphenodon punctatus TaxID=8508 RepID=A0A8D0L381_SPHPU